MKREGFDLAAYRAVIDQLDGADLRETDTLVMGDAETRLRKGEGVIAPLPFEAGEATLLGLRSDTTEEGFERQINAYRHILQHLGMHAIKGGSLLFQGRKSRLLLVECQALASLFVDFLALFQQVVIQPTALFEGLVELVKVLLGGVDAIAKHFTHAYILALNTRAVKGKSAQAQKKERA